MAQTSIAQAQTAHQLAHTAFLQHVRSNCNDCAFTLCREARGLELDADAAGLNWERLDAKRLRCISSDRISLTAAGAAYLAGRRQAVAV